MKNKDKFWRVPTIVPGTQKLEATTISIHKLNRFMKIFMRIYKIIFKFNLVSRTSIDIDYMSLCYICARSMTIFRI